MPSACSPGRLPPSSSSSGFERRQDGPPTAGGGTLLAGVGATVSGPTPGIARPDIGSVGGGLHQVPSGWT